MSRSKNRKRQLAKQRANKRTQPQWTPPQDPTLIDRMKAAVMFARESFTPPPDYDESPRAPLRWYNLRRHELAVLILCALLALGSLTLALATREEPAAPVVLKAIPLEAKLKVNLVPAESLRVIPGVGEAISERIVAEREAAGPFNSLEEMGERVLRFRVKSAKPFERYLDFTTR